MSRDEEEISAVVSDLEQLMARLRASVGALQDILTTEPEVPGDQPAPA